MEGSTAIKHVPVSLYWLRQEVFIHSFIFSFCMITLAQVHCASDVFIVYKLNASHSLAHISVDLGIIQHYQYTNLLRSSPAVDIPQQHQYPPKSHHIQYPTYYWYKSPLCLHFLFYLLPVATDHLYIELYRKTMIHKDETHWQCSCCEHTFTAHTSISRVEAVMGQDWPTRAF